MKTNGNHRHRTTGANALLRLLLLAAAVSIAACSKTGPEDAGTAVMTRFENLSGVRYCEVFLIAGNPITKDLHANFYNTSEFNNSANKLNTCPAELWAKVDAEALKKQYDVLGVFKNGPRFWMYDWAELPVGTERDFDGLKARWFGNVKLPKDFGKEGATYFKPTTVERKSHQGYKQGQTVYILDDPEGTPWIMQAGSGIVDSSLRFETLNTLEQKLVLPPGWKYRTKVLEQDLGVSAINGVARIVQDNLQNTYNACFEEGGQKNCTYKP